MKIYLDIETMERVTEQQLKAEFEMVKAEDLENHDYSFNEYEWNCLTRNGGTLVLIGE